MTISPEGKELLDTIVGKQEGGWVLTENKYDNDGGWTFGGVTSKTYNHYFQNNGLFSFIEAANWNKFHPDDMISDCLAIYQDNYIQPLQLFSLPASIRGPLLSAAINCGVKEAVMILQRSCNLCELVLGPHPQPLDVDGVVGASTRNTCFINRIQIVDVFLREWMRYYIKLVTNPSDAFLQSGGLIMHRVPFLEGWFNRVEFWRV